jgi:hypothetical protein
VFAAVGLAALAGCGDRTCQSTCLRIWDEAQCGVQLTGIDPAEAISDCRNQCEDALANAGEMGDYNPFGKVDPLDPPLLENEKQAAAWMDCVWETDCALIQPEGGGICAPIL